MCGLASRFLGAVFFVFGSVMLPNAWASPEWVDMGPISGSVQGHVWSKVVDEVGNTRGRAESWTLNSGVLSKIVVTLRAPEAQNLELRVNLRHPDGDTSYLQLPYPGTEIPGGYRTVVNNVIPGAKPTRERSAMPSISVMPVRNSTDQRYQLTVEIFPLDGSSPGVMPPQGGVDAFDLSGIWQHGNNGEHWTITRQPDGRYQAVEKGYGNARGTVTVAPGGRFRIDHTYNNSQGQCSGHYEMTLDPDGKKASGSWHDNCAKRSGTTSMKRVSSIPTGTAGTGSVEGSGALTNLALGKPTKQSSTYSGTGVDQGPQHAVDGKTSGRDPHDLIHTNYEKNPWWRVDLGTKAAIEKIVIYNRTNPQVLSNLPLELLASDDGKNWRSVYVHDKSVFKILSVPVKTTGRYVVARLISDRDALQLYEIEVIGRAQFAASGQ